MTKKLTVNISDSVLHLTLLLSALRETIRRMRRDLEEMERQITVYISKD